MRACLSPRKLRVSIYESRMKESSADCCRHPKVCTIRIPYVASLFFLDHSRKLDPRFDSFKSIDTLLNFSFKYIIAI